MSHSLSPLPKVKSPPPIPPPEIIQQIMPTIWRHAATHTRPRGKSPELQPPLPYTPLHHHRFVVCCVAPMCCMRARTRTVHPKQPSSPSHANQLPVACRSVSVRFEHHRYPKAGSHSALGPRRHLKISELGGHPGLDLVDFLKPSTCAQQHICSSWSSCKHKPALAASCQSQAIRDRHPQLL